jgi:hypothetical protein
MIQDSSKTIPRTHHSIEALKPTELFHFFLTPPASFLKTQKKKKNGAGAVVRKEKYKQPTGLH